MTSKGEIHETSEFLRRRQLRLQQVREQSKDVAKKIRQRAKVEKLRQVVELDERKEKDYKWSQKKVIKKLEELYSRGLNNVGSSHNQAHGLTQSVSVNVVEKADLSHLRGREAAAEAKRQKQQKLDQLKKSLDRKIQAREAANELSREKSACAANRLSKLSSKINIVNEETKTTSENVNGDLNLNNKDLAEEVSKADMGTQWDIDLLPPEWEPNVPALALPQEDDIKDSAADKDYATDKQRKTDLFALSDEMPSSLRGGTDKPSETGPSKLSSTLVSEYIQNRVLRLREPEVKTSKQQSEDLKNLRQTITRTRPLRPEGSAFSNICRVVDGEALHVPVWHPETGCQCQSPRILHSKQFLERKHFPHVTHSNKMFSSKAPVTLNSVSCPASRKARPLISHKCCGYSELAAHANGLLRGKESDNVLVKKKSVTTYNHSTRDTRDVPRADERLVYRDRSSEQDAYSQALSESMSACSHDKQKKNQDSVSKVAVTRQNVEKEYKDTIAFLNSLPKHKNTRPINNAFKDDHRLQAQRDSRQRILQQEFRNIEEESRRQDAQGYKSKSRLQDRSPPKRSKSPANCNVDGNLYERDFRYSWMPVPESDSKLAVHTIPTGARGGPGGRAPAAHSVKFNVDSYHEYRSRHKHTPPTKDTASSHSQPDRKLVQTVIFQKDDDSMSDESAATETSSTDGRDSDPKQNVDIDDSSKRRELTDTERIIIYKILNYKHRKKNKSSKVNSTGDVDGGNERSKDAQDDRITQLSSKDAISKDDEADINPLGIDRLTEGVYEVAGRKEFSCNVLNCYPTNVDPWKSMSHRNDWWDNLEYMYYSGLDKIQSRSTDDKHKQGHCSRRTGAGDDIIKTRKKCSSAKCKGHSPKSQTTAASVSTAPADPSAAATPAAAVAAASVHDAGFVKLLDDGQKQQSNFYIGATGFLKNDAYEVIIQLRKNDTAKEVTKTQDVPVDKPITADIVHEDTKIKIAPSLEHTDGQYEKLGLGDDSNYSAGLAPPPSTATDLNYKADSAEGNEKAVLGNGISEDVQPPKTTQERSVSTSFNDPMPEPIAKTESVARPATSTCTQTTPSPSNPRPVYIHMSSSTSTAYMSPPEVVLPHFFKRGHKPSRKTRQTARNIEKQEGRDFIRQEHHCNSYSSCKVFEKMFTEPKNGRMNFRADIYSEKNECTPSSSVRNTKCSKYSSRGDPGRCCKHHTRKMKHHLSCAKQNLSMCNAKNSVVHSIRNKTNKLSNKSYLSPMIKQYIHKLLSLNREDIKAIKIMNQDCSSVNTPASSIINMPTNFSSNYQRTRLGFGSRDWEKFETILKHRLFLQNNATQAMITRPENFTKIKNKNARNSNLRTRNTKNKRVHKVKSLNISKRIVVKTSNVSTKTKVDHHARKHTATSEQYSSPMNPIESFEISNDKKNILTARTNSKEIPKRPVDQYVRDDFHSVQLMAVSSNSNDEVPSKPINNSTQTSCTTDGEINFIKLAEGKLQNMEKIADLTEKCTKRLSNLAKVLEEVRKNKSLAYSQVSTADSTSESDQKSDKIGSAENLDLKIPLNIRDHTARNNNKNEYNIDSTDYESLISGVPKSSNIEFPLVQSSDNDVDRNGHTECTSQSVSSVSTNDECRENYNTRCRNKPPPALLRLNLKRPQDNVVPHELSTVMEVDSPLSVKFKQQSPVSTNKSTNSLADLKKNEKDTVERQVQNIVNKASNDKNKVTFSDSSEESKLQMMDLNQFNEIMLRPFVSLQEYARDHYERSTHTKLGNFSKELGITDDISSLHSDGSLPDVVAELLKRKLITEPFRFDTASNMNSTTISSESTLSVLALSKIPKGKCKSKLTTNKENVGETSDSLSISSNPDLENSFKKLGMGWASSTLKKTKERLALSSSSNTSSSSLSHIKFKTPIKQDEPVADAIWSVSNISKKPALKRRLDTSKNAEQQTSFTNNMTVKEFLTKELAKKITFTESNRNNTNQEFVSLYETKLPEALKHSLQTMLDDNSGDSAPSGNNNRARTSTPVKLFKSVTYHSSSSSNVSNGLFSNADELSSVKLTSASARQHSASEKDELTVPNCSLKMRKTLSDCSKTDSC